jgi:hypothetical protein
MLTHLPACLRMPDPWLCVDACVACCICTARTACSAWMSPASHSLPPALRTGAGRGWCWPAAWRAWCSTRPRSLCRRGRALGQVRAGCGVECCAACGHVGCCWGQGIVCGSADVDRCMACALKRGTHRQRRPTLLPTLLPACPPAACIPLYPLIPLQRCRCRGTRICGMGPPQSGII